MAGNDTAYWSQRMKLMEDALKDRSFSYVENMERQFAIAQAEVERQTAAWYHRFAANNEITLADAKRLLASGELEELRWTVGEYIAYGQQNALDGAWMKQLENASARVHISRLEALKLQIQQQAEALYANQLDLVDAAAREMYLGSYYGTAFEVQRGLGVGWSLGALDERAIEKVLSRPWTADGQSFRDRCWTNKQDLVNSVNTQLTQMIIRGEAPDKAISAISHQFKVSRDKAGRLIMTEAAAFSSAAQKDCFDELGVERFRVVAALDRDTCELCGAMDGQVFKMSEYQVGLTAPPFHPWCRCCTAPYFDDMEGLGERWSRKPDGTTEMVPADMSYEEWREKLVNGPSKNKLTLYTESSKITSTAAPEKPKPLTVEQVKERMTAQVEALPEELKQALQNYTGYDATEINSAIRHGRITPAIQRKIDLLDAALRDGVMPETVVLHRDTVFSFLGLDMPSKPTAEELSRIVRRPLINNIFTSTSFENLGLPGRDTELWLTVPAGYRGCQFLQPVARPKFKDQIEVLFARGLKYRITDAKIENGKYVLFAEVLK